MAPPPKETRTNKLEDRVHMSHLADDFAKAREMLDQAMSVRDDAVERAHLSMDQWQGPNSDQIDIIMAGLQDDI